jgi:hypothetical protein
MTVAEMNDNIPPLNEFHPPVFDMSDLERTDNMPPRDLSLPANKEGWVDPPAWDEEQVRSYARAYAEQETKALQHDIARALATQTELLDELEWEKMRSGSNRRKAEELQARIEVLEELETLTMVELRQEVDRQAGRIVGLLETIQDLKQFHPHYQE